VPDGVFRPKSYLPPVPEGPAGYTGSSLSAPSDVEAHLTRLSREHPEIYSRVFRGLLQIGSQSSSHQGYGSQHTNYRGYLGDQGHSGWQGIQGRQGAQGWQGSQGLPGRLGPEGHEGLPSALREFFDFDRLYTIPELEIIGHALYCPYLFMGAPEEPSGEGIRGWLDFDRSGRVLGLHSFSVWQMPGVGMPAQRAYHAEVSFFCEDWGDPIVRWSTALVRDGSTRIVAGYSGPRAPHITRDGRVEPRVAREVFRRFIHVRIDSLTSAALGMTFRRPQGE